MRSDKLGPLLLAVLLLLIGGEDPAVWTAVRARWGAVRRTHWRWLR